jgi:hypothetical protein
MTERRSESQVKRERNMYSQRGTAYVALGRIRVEVFVECLNSGLSRK